MRAIDSQPEVVRTVIVTEIEKIRSS